MREWKKVFYANGSQKKARVAIFVSDKIDFKTKTENKEKILKAAREKQQVTYKRNPKHLIDEFFSRNSAGQKGMAGYI